MSHLYRPSDAEVWPENWPTWELFDRVSTQWRVGMRGAIGLDYCAIYPVMDRMQLGADDWLQMLDDIHVMEAAALDELRKAAGGPDA